MIGAQCHHDVAHAHGEEHEAQDRDLPLCHTVLHDAEQQRVAVIELKALQREQEGEEEQQRGCELFQSKAAVFTACVAVSGCTCAASSLRTRHIHARGLAHRNEFVQSSLLVARLQDLHHALRESHVEILLDEGSECGSIGPGQCY